jgi:uncharacterized repeat protein (TIGR03803 family)
MFAAVLVSAVITTQSAQAATFTTLYSFCAQPLCADGANPEARLIQGTDGDFYGTTAGGGAIGNGYGTVFKITPSGTLTTLYTFCSQINCTDGADPRAGLIQATNGDFYGTTYEGGANTSDCSNGCGTIFKITANGTLTTLHSFDIADGEYITAGLVQATNGDFYGTTAGGGANGYGTVFKITPKGTLTTLYSFCSHGTYPDCTDGASPEAGLIEATNGDFYGTTANGGANPNNNCLYFCGTVFKITPSGKLTTLQSFDYTHGAYPYGNLVQATNGDFYGTTANGGADTSDCSNGCGTIFKITASGTLTTLHSFDDIDGEYPNGGLIQGTDGNIYGTTEDGAKGGGTIFELTPGGTVTALYSFCSQTNCADGAYPEAGLFQGTDGDFYGTTLQRGANASANDCSNGCGTIFSLSVGLGPFVETQTTSGKVGAAVKILGTDLTGATNVTFNGTAATFTVVSVSEITTTVPSGAATGFVEVTTPNGTLTSNVKFRVTP